MPFVLATAIFMQMLDSTILNTALPQMAEDLNESPLNMQSAIISYVLTMALLIPLSGYLADRFGTRKIFLISLIIFSLGSLFCAMSQSLFMLNASRVVQGIGGSMMIPVARLALIKTFEKKEFVQAMNYAIVPALIGPILGPLMGGYLVQYVSWHWIFLINIPIGLFGIVMGYFFMPDYSRPQSSMDFKGFVLFGIASIVLSVSLELMGHPKMLTPVILLLLAGGLFLYVYFRHARKSEDALFPTNLFLIRTFRVGLIGNLASRLGISSVPLLIPLLIQVPYGQSATTSGWMVAPLAVAAMLSKQTVIPIINKIGYKPILIGNTVIIGIMIMLLAVPGPHTSIYWFLPLTFLMGWFNSVQFTAMNSLAIADLREFNTSSGNSLLAVNQQLAIGFGVAIGLTILRFVQTRFGQNAENLHMTFRITFIIVGVMTMLSSLIFLRLHRTDGDNMRVFPDDLKNLPAE